MMVRTLGITQIAALLAIAPSTSLANWSSDPTGNLAVCLAEGDQQMPKILPDAYGGAWIVWSDTRVAPNHADIYVQHVLAQGVVDPLWPADGALACGAWSAQFLPAIVSDGGSGVLVAWSDQRISAANPDIYIQHILGNGVVDPTWTGTGVPVVTSFSFQFPPQMISDGSGGAFLAFGSHEGSVNNIYAQHILASGVRDPEWPESGLPVCSASGDQTTPYLVTDGAGGMFIAWDDNRSGAGGVYAARVLASGSPHPAWPADGFAVCATPATAGSVRLVPDGSGGAIISWRDERASTQGDIYAQHVRADATVDPAWPVDGRAVCAATGEQNSVSLVEDGSRGALLAWSDKRGAHFDIYAHHLLADGTLDAAWPASGRALCTATGDQTMTSYALLADGEGGALCAWRDARFSSTTQDVYAGHVLASGIVDPAWPTDGRAVCIAAGNQVSPVACGDGSGGLLAVWADMRAGASDLYAQRVAADGTLPTVSVPGARLENHLLEPPLPNPAMQVTLLRFSLGGPCRARLEVLDVAGRVIRGLADDLLPGGPHHARWDLADDAGRRVPAGIYMARLTVNGRSHSRRLAVLGGREP